MSRYSYDPEAYEKRYRKVYEIGAEFWERLEPTETLAKFVSETRMPKRSRVIEFGCGEGRDSVFLSRKGFRVLGVDSARSALVNAKWRSKKERTGAEFVVADIRSLPTKDGVFDLAINVACLHMITDQDGRDRHLRESKRIMKAGGKYLSCNLGGRQGNFCRRILQGAYRETWDLDFQKNQGQPSRTRGFSAYHSRLAEVSDSVCGRV
jgi:ubiquinone/menaquinone biosynthesis C-methylase UbiE